MNRPPPTSNATVLLTAFDTFGGNLVNPSALAVQALAAQPPAEVRLVTAVLPTVFGTSAERMRRLLREHRPDLVICTGQAGGRTAISLERVAINVNDARIPDNEGAQPVDTPVVPGGPAAFFTRLPIKAMYIALLEAGIRAEVSQTAGTFVCNHVFYALLHELAHNPLLHGTRGGMIHLPWVEQQGAPHMPLPEIVAGLTVAIRCALATPRDVAVEAGALS